jgi:hypothetical protein
MVQYLTGKSCPHYIVLDWSQGKLPESDPAGENVTIPGVMMQVDATEEMTKEKEGMEEEDNL